MLSGSLIQQSLRLAASLWYDQFWRPTPFRTEASRTITNGVTWPVGIAVDAHDTLYVTNGTASMSRNIDQGGVHRTRR
jgi:hypothetical protein